VTQALFTYDEVDEILRLDGHNDYVGLSAIDGLIAVVAAGPAYSSQRSGCRMSSQDRFRKERKGR
jgi:hypothetical protein